MFTGIVECTSVVQNHTNVDNGLSMVIAKPQDWEVTVGQSIAVNGVCLTVETYNEEAFTVTLVPETLKLTTFGTAIPKTVNLERAMQMNGRLDGHMVQGHVDAVGTVKRIIRTGLSVEMMIAFDASFTDLTVAKGSVAINGVSLTIVLAEDACFSVVLIPHTLEVTTLGSIQEGDAVNLEFDIIGKYVQKGNRNSK